MPKIWKESFICPINKKGDTVYKIMTIAINNRLNQTVETEKYQYFHRNRSLMDQVLISKQILDKS